MIVETERPTAADLAMATAKEAEAEVAHEAATKERNETIESWLKGLDPDKFKEEQDVALQLEGLRDGNQILVIRSVSYEESESEWYWKSAEVVQLIQK